MSYSDKWRLFYGFILAMSFHGLILFNPFIILDESYQLKKGNNKYSIKAKLQLTAKKVVIQTPKKGKLVKKKKSIKKDQLVQEKTIQKVRKSQVKQKNKILSSYLFKVRELVAKNKFYPFVAKKMGYEGKVDLKVIINSQGHVLDTKIVRPSEYEVLNKAALQIITKIKHFDPFPQGLNRDLVEVTLPVVYELIL